MSDVFDFSNQDMKPDPPFVVRADDAAEWTKSGLPGFTEKELYSGSDGSARVLLMRVEPGSFAPTHAHEEVEHVYILDGTFRDEYGSYGPGDYLVRNPGAAHEARSDEGSTVLLVYSRRP